MKNIVHRIDNMEHMATLPDNNYDLAIDDPPYFEGVEMDYFYHGGESKYGSLAPAKKLDFWKIPDKQYYNELCRISTAQIIWGINYYDFGLTPSGRIIWDKNNQNSTFSDCEIALCSLIKSVRKIVCTWDGFRMGSETGIKRIHKTQKPVALYKWLLQNYAKAGQTIFDPHVGSRSLGIACNDLGFSYEGCEIDPGVWAEQEYRYDVYKIRGGDMKGISLSKIPNSILDE